jgi:hypothetical protein
MAKNTLYTDKDFVDVYDGNGVKLGPVPKSWLGTDLLPAGVTDKAPASDKADVVIPDGDASEDWTADQLKAYAKRENIALGSATSKGDIVKVIADAKTSV